MGQYSTDLLSWVGDPQAEMHPRFWLFWFKMSSNDFTRGKNETRCLTGLTLHFGAKTANLNWRNSEINYTSFTWKRNSFPPGYVEIVSIVCFGTKDYFSRIEFVRFYAHYRKKKRVFLWVLQSINNIFNCNCGLSPPTPPPPQRFRPLLRIFWIRPPIFTDHFFLKIGFHRWDIWVYFISAIEKIFT